MSTTLTPDHIMEVGMGFLASKTLLSAIELELFTVLGDASLTASETTAKLGLHERSHLDLLDALVSLGFLDRDGVGPGARKFKHRRDRHVPRQAEPGLLRRHARDGQLQALRFLEQPDRGSGDGTPPERDEDRWRLFRIALWRRDPSGRVPPRHARPASRQPSRAAREGRLIAGQDIL